MQENTAKIEDFAGKATRQHGAAVLVPAVLGAERPNTGTVLKTVIQIAQRTSFFTELVRTAVKLADQHGQRSRPGRKRNAPMARKCDRNSRGGPDETEGPNGMRATTNDPFRLGVDCTSPAKGRLRLLLEAGLRPGKSARPARFSGRPLSRLPLGLRQRLFHYEAEWVKFGSGSCGAVRSPSLGVRLIKDIDVLDAVSADNR